MAQVLSRDAVVPVYFEFGPASAGWIGLTVRAGGQSDIVSCSNVYDPFVELAQWATRVAEGYQACLEIDEEGRYTQAWLSREPGSAIGCLQVFEPGPSGRPEPARIDAVVDCVQLAHAYHDAFSAYLGIHDPRHWDWDDDGVARSSPRNRLAGVEIRGLAAALQSYGVIPTVEPFAELREAYEAELGDRAMPVILSDTPPAKRSTCR